MPLCYFRILSTSPVHKRVNILFLNISKFSTDYENHIIEDYLQLPCHNRSVKSVIGRHFLVCFMCVYECHDITAHDVMKNASKMSVTVCDVMTTT